jgi:hypothetical protein
LRLHLTFCPLLRPLALSFLLAFVIPSASLTQQAPQKPSEKPIVKPSPPAEKSENPYQIELLETSYRFEASGDSRKEVHTRVNINNELGVRQFARINFDYNRSFQSIEIPLVHITHPGGGTADILPSAITDNPNPAVVNAPAYQDVRVKSVRILGLAPGDTLEYRIITTTTHHPLAPDFWLDHSFDRSGIVSHEIFDLDFPSSRKPEIRINPATPATSTDKSGEGEVARSTYRWELSAASTPARSQPETKESGETAPDVALSTAAWEMLSIRLDEQLMPGAKPLEKISSDEEFRREPFQKRTVSPEVTERALELAKGTEATKAKLEGIYDFVSQKIRTIDLPLGATGYKARPASEVLATGYATQEDKFVLFAALATAVKLSAGAALTGYCDAHGVSRPTVFKHLLISVQDGDTSFWLDPSLEVAPFGMISSLPQKCIFVLNRKFLAMNSTGHEWQPFERKLPFAAHQKVQVDATLANDGNLTAKVHYSLRGDNELLLRIAFHQSSKEKWKDLAQLLSLSDGFRGQVTNVTASDPYATKEPFTVDYEITQPKFVDWSKKPVRIPALLPQLGLPDPPAKPAPGAAVSPIELGTPLEVDTRMTLHLPSGTAIVPPTGTSIVRDYATFASQYSAKGQTVTASRHINFLQRQVPADRAADYNAFLRAVQNDQAQGFTLDRASLSAPAARPAASSAAGPPPTPKP